MKILFRIFFLLLVIVALPGLAFSHATPVQYVPAASSVLSQAPAEVQIHFSEGVEPHVSSIAVLGPDGSRVDLVNSGVDPADRRVLSREPQGRRQRNLHGFMAGYFG